MKIVIFGLTISSSWGNGHATLWRGLCSALAERGHEIVFFERDVPYYAANRDLTRLPYGELVLYPNWPTVQPLARRELADAQVAIVTSYCPDAVAAADSLASNPKLLRVFYDLDTPVTLARLHAGERVDYIGPEGLKAYDLVLSFTGGRALTALREELGAVEVLPLYGSVDPAVHGPTTPREAFAGDLSYLGTYAADRQPALERFLVEPAIRLPHRRFVIGGALYPNSFPWQANIYFTKHLPPADHAAFYCSSRLTLNITRQAMAESGFCPSGRLFEAAACGAAILSDAWEGLETFFEVGREILIAHSTEDAIAAIEKPAAELSAIGQAARTRVLAEHTSARRAEQLEEMLSERMDQAGERLELSRQPAPAVALEGT